MSPTCCWRCSVELTFPIFNTKTLQLMKKFWNLKYNPITLKKKFLVSFTTCFGVQSYGRPRILTITWPPRERNAWASLLLPKRQRIKKKLKTNAPSKKLNKEFSIKKCWFSHNGETTLSVVSKIHQQAKILFELH